MKHLISLFAALMAASPIVGEDSELPARMLTPSEYLVGPISYDPFQYIHLDEEAGEILMLLSAVHAGRGESRAFFHRTRLAEAADSEPKLLSEPGRNAAGAQLRIGGDGRLHAAWLKLVPKRENWITYRYSDDRGQSWSEPQSFLAGFSPRGPQLQLLDDSTVVLGTSSSPERPSKGERVYLWVSSDSGVTWQERDINFVDRVGSTSVLSLAVGPQRRILAAWVDMSEEGTRIAGNVSQDGGRSWLKEPVHISDDPQRRVESFRLFSDDEGFSIAWLAGGGRNHQLMFDRSDLSGVGWGEDRLLAAPQADRIMYDVEFSRERIFCIWTEFEGYGRFLQGTLKVQGFAHPSLEEVYPETVIYDAGQVGQTMVGFDIAFESRQTIVSAIAHSVSEGWYVGVWKLDSERKRHSLVWEDRAGSAKEVTTAALKTAGDRVLLLTRESRTRRLPQESVFNGSMNLRVLEVSSFDEETAESMN